MTAETFEIYGTYSQEIFKVGISLWNCVAQNEDLNFQEIKSRKGNCGITEIICVCVCVCKERHKECV